MEELLEKLKNSGPIGFWMALKMYKQYKYLRSNRIPDVPYLQKKFKGIHGYDLDLDNPKTLNEKIQWLKINDRRAISTQLADKYAVREYIKEHFGEEYLIPLLFESKKAEDIRSENLPDIPFILKTNHDSGNYEIIRDKNKIDWKKLRNDFKWWMSINFYYLDREWQYKNIEPRVIAEKLLVSKAGKIPNDYKLHCINGEVAFVYVSVDREGLNKRNIYDKDWKPLNFTFANKWKNTENLRGEEIEAPKSYPQMVEFAERIAKLYAYVRVDFYDVDGKLYFGEVTHHHGGGYDLFKPVEWDRKWGDMIDLDYGR